MQYRSLSCTIVQWFPSLPNWENFLLLLLCSLCNCITCVCFTRPLPSIFMQSSMSKSSLVTSAGKNIHILKSSSSILSLSILLYPTLPLVAIAVSSLTSFTLYNCSANFTLSMREEKYCPQGEWERWCTRSNHLNHFPLLCYFSHSRNILHTSLALSLSTLPSLITFLVQCVSSTMLVSLVHQFWERVRVCILQLSSTDTLPLSLSLSSTHTFILDCAMGNILKVTLVPCVYY